MNRASCERNDTNKSIVVDETHRVRKKYENIDLYETYSV